MEQPVETGDAALVVQEEQPEAAPQLSASMPLPPEFPRYRPPRPQTGLTPRSRKGLPPRVNSARSSSAQLYAGFHGSDDKKISTLITALDDLWKSPSGMQGYFIDLGCGDGRVVHEVASAFPSRQCKGVDIQEVLIDKAKSEVKRKRLEANCAFEAADLATVDLSEASVVFLYFPPMALPALLTVLRASNLRNGAAIVSADGAWRSRDAAVTHRHAAWAHSQSELLELLQPWRHCWGTADLYFYTWRGNTVRTAEASAAEEVKVFSADAAVKAAQARVSAYMREEKSEKERQQQALIDDLVATRIQLKAATEHITRQLPHRIPSARSRPPSTKRRCAPSQRMHYPMLDVSPYHSKLPSAWSVAAPFRDGGTVYFGAPTQTKLERAYGFYAPRAAPRRESREVYRRPITAFRAYY